MRICIDIQAAVSQRAGVGRYTQQLVEHLGPLAGDDGLALFYFDFRRQGLPFAVPAADPRAVRWCPGRLIQQAWKRLHWPPFDWFAGPADVYHFPNFAIPPLTRGKRVVTIHDMSFLRFPEFAEPRNLRYLSRVIHRTAREADAIITDSAFSASEIRALLGVAPDRIHAIHLGVDPRCAPAAPAAVAALRGRLGLERPYLLTVGTVEPRKNLPLLIEAFERMAAFDGDLVMAGMPGWKYAPILERMRTSARAARIRYLQYVPDDALPALYTGAEIFLLASHYEGFGLPPLEAMACGTPVVSSTGGSLPEVLGDAAVLIDGCDAAHWAQSIGRVLADAGQRRDLSARGRRQAARYGWQETARKTWEVYRSV